jgi:hypothetical protein
MSTTTDGDSSIKKLLLVAAGVAAIVLLCGFGVTGYFRLSSGPAALRKSLLQSLGGDCEKKIELHAGWCTVAIARIGSTFFKLPPEPRAVIDSLRAVEAGVYKLREVPSPATRSDLLAKADLAMNGGGWERLAGVIAGDKLTAIYVPREGRSASRTTFCLMALHGRKLVVASATVNPQPLLELAAERFETRLTR